jgi:hypothetical protein
VVDPAEQLIPVGELVTVPAPGPAIVTVTARPPLNAAETFVAAVTVTVQALVPEQPPPFHPPKYWPEPAVAVSVTCVLGAKSAEHVPGQLIPAGLLVTVPVPVTATVSESAPLNDADTLVAALSITVHVVAVPEQLPPLHPLKKLFAAGFSVRVTCVFGAKLAEHVPGQLIPPGLLVTVPLPEAGPVTFN